MKKILDFLFYILFVVISFTYDINIMAKSCVLKLDGKLYATKEKNYFLINVESNNEKKINILNYKSINLKKPTNVTASINIQKDCLDSDECNAFDLKIENLISQIVSPKNYNYAELKKIILESCN